MTKNEVMKKVFDIIKSRRENANLLAEQNRNLALKNPDYLSLFVRERALSFDIGKAKFEGADVQSLEKEFESLQQQKQKILESLGLSISDLAPKYTCEKCGDTGFLNNKLCSCASQLYNNILMKECGINLNEVPSLSDYDYKFFDTTEEVNYAKKCVKILSEYVENFDSLTVKNIIICGASGTGKTYLTKCIAKELIRLNKTTLFTSAFDLNNMFLEEHLSQTDQKTNLKDLSELDALIIDDLGTEPIRRNVTKEYLLLLVSERLAKNKATIITTNLSPNDVLDRYEERIFSRLFNKRSTLILEFKGKNNRLKR